jgi:16S rRNA (cytosine1402-N4)-methyltransferase
MEAAALHCSVLLKETVSGIVPRSGGYYIDATCGLGGHSEAVLEASAPEGRLLSVDRDPRALEYARKRLSRFGQRCQLVEAKFSEIQAYIESPADGLIADLGVSSLQFDDEARGFSFRADVPLDMRMSDSGQSAAELLQAVDEQELTTILQSYGEVKRSRKAARAILAARDKNALNSTKDLVKAVEGVFPKKPGLHPATLVFQAIRIAVNRELDELDALLQMLPDVLAPGGRAAIISFHSLEDRRVKRAFRTPAIHPDLRNLPLQGPGHPFKEINRRPIVPGEREVDENPRARSAKLRVAERSSERDVERAEERRLN